jgi:hypothetical protein
MSPILAVCRSRSLLLIRHPLDLTSKDPRFLTEMPVNISGKFVLCLGGVKRRFELRDSCLEESCCIAARVHSCRRRTGEIPVVRAPLIHQGQMKQR